MGSPEPDKADSLYFPSGIKKEPNKVWTPRTVMIGGKVRNLISLAFQIILENFKSTIVCVVVVV